jgi:hypothetical protein
MAWVWPAFWIIVAISFGCLEGYALKTGKMTLSRWNWNMEKAWSPWGICFGLVAGGLLVHLFWPGQGCNITGF